MTELSPLRTAKITGSRIGTVLKLNRYQKPAELIVEMVRQYHGLPPLFVGNVATAHGALHEIDALTAYEVEQSQMVHSAQEFVPHPFYDFLGVTLDGKVGRKGLVEFKAPYSGRYNHISDKPDHEAQCRLGIECTGREWCDYGVWRQGRPLAVSRVHFDPLWLPSVLPRLLDFMTLFWAAANDPAVLAREKGRGTVAEAPDPGRLLADKARWKWLLEQEQLLTGELEEVKLRIAEQLGDSEVVTVDGVPVARWQYRNGASTFDRPAFRKAHPDLEAQYSRNGAATQFPVLVDQPEGETA